MADLSSGFVHNLKSSSRPMRRHNLLSLSQLLRSSLNKSQQEKSFDSHLQIFINRRSNKHPLPARTPRFNSQFHQGGLRCCLENARFVFVSHQLWLSLPARRCLPPPTASTRAAAKGASPASQPQWPRPLLATLFRSPKALIKKM